MLARAPDVVHVCLRCRQTLARQTREWLLPPTRPGFKPSNLRFQSTAAAKEIDDPEDEPRVDAPEAYSSVFDAPETFKDGHGEEPGQGPKPRPRRKRNSDSDNVISLRKWKPAKTAGLGMDALGKPSEILLLTPRNRSFPTPPTEILESKQSVADALKAELEDKTTWQQIKDHIEESRSQISQQRGQLEPEQWGVLHRYLRKSFNRWQLEKYLNEHNVDLWTHVAYQGHPPKQLQGTARLAALVAVEVWGYQLPKAPDFEILTNRVKEVRIKEPDDILLLQRDPIVGLGKIESNYNVSTSVQNQVVTVTGGTGLGKACKVLKSRKSYLSDIRLNGFGTELLNPKLQKSLDNLLNTKAIEHGVLLKKTPKGLGIQARYFQANESAIKWVRRDLRLAASELKRPSRTVTAQPERCSLAPFPMSSRLPWFTEKSSWSRISDMVLTGLGGSARRAESGLQAATEWEGIKTELNETPRPDGLGSASPNALRFEHSARFGMSLFDIDHSTKPKVTTMGRRASLFVDEAPLVSELLSQPQFQNQPVKTTTTTDVPAGSSLLVRVVLKPVKHTSRSPVIEIYLTGEAQELGLQQNLNIARISAIVEEKTYNLSFPALPVDIQFTRQLKQDVFVRRSPTTSEHPDLLRSIAEYLARTRQHKTEEPNFFFFEKIPIIPSLQRSQPSDAAPPKGKKIKNPSPFDEYFLASVETVDADTRLAPQIGGGGGTSSPKSTFALEHIAYGGGKWGPNRQELKLSEAALLSAPPASPSGEPLPLDVDLFFRTAVDVAERFVDLDKDLRQKMFGTQ